MKSLPLYVYIRGLLSCLCFLVLSLVSLGTVWAQAETDLQVTIESQPETAHGGEQIKYVYSIKNNGPLPTEAVLLGGNETMLKYVSATASKGDCTINDRDDNVLRCMLGNLSPGESAAVEITASITDVDDLASRGYGSGVESGLPNRRPVEEQTEFLSWVHVYSSVNDVNHENDRVELRLKLRPSANKPPVLKVLSPKDNEVFIRPSGQVISRTVSIEASDPDGKIVAVKVEDPTHGIRPVGVDQNGYVFEYEGVRYSALELDAFIKNHPPRERLATPVGKNIYSYTMTNLPYGRSQLFVSAVDDGGRSASSVVYFEVKSDSTIEIVSPKKNEIVEPGSSMTVETVSTLKQGRLLGVTVSGDGVALNGEPLKMELVSKQGSVYRHRFQIDRVPPNSVWSNLEVQLNEVDGGYVDAHVGFLVRDLPRMEFTSLHDGEAVQPEMRDGARTVEIRVEIENRSCDDNYELLIDGKYHASFISDGLYWIRPESGKHTLQIVATFGSIRDRIEIARSPLITVTVR